METPTQGAIARIFNDEPLSQSFRPVLEVRDVKRLSEKRFAVSVTDGTHLVKTVCAQNSSMLPIVESGTLQVFTLLRLQEVQLVQAGKMRAISIVAAEVLPATPEHLRVPAEALRKWGPKAEAASQAFQASQSLHVAAAPEHEAETQPAEGLPIVAEAPSAGPPATFAANLALEKTPPPRRTGSPLGRDVTPPAPSPVPRVQQGNPYAAAPRPEDKGNPCSNPYVQAAAQSQAAQQHANPYMQAAAQSQAAAPTQPQRLFAPLSAPLTSSASQKQADMRSFFAQKPAKPAKPASRPSAPPGWGSWPQTLTQVATADAGPLTPIAGLHPYVGSKWKIKARLTLKGDIRKFTNARGEGQLLKLELTDASGEMSVTLFGKAVDKFNPVLHPGKVYFFSKGRIQAANPRYDKGSYVATLEEHSIIELAEDDDRSIPAVQYKFMALWDVDQSADTNMQLDVKGVICNVEDPFTITTRATQEQRTKREITLWDDSGPDASSTIVVTIWGDRAFDEFEAGTVGFFRGCRVNEWQGRKSLNSNGQYELNPDNPEAFRLMGRYDASGRPCASTQPRRTGALATVEEVLAQNLQLGPAPIPGQQLAGGGAKSIQWNSVRVTLIESLGAKAPYYNSCPEMVPMTKKGETQAPDRMRPCRKKVTQDGDRWRCDAGHSCAKPSCRYIFRADFADYSGTMNVSVFDEVGEKIIGCPADELAHFWESASQAEEAQRLLHKAGFAQVVLRTRSQRELWNNEEQVKITADSCSPIDFAGAGRQMLAEVMASI